MPVLTCVSTVYRECRPLSAVMANAALYQCPRGSQISYCRYQYQLQQITPATGEFYLTHQFFSSDLPSQGNLWTLPLMKHLGLPMLVIEL